MPELVPVEPSDEGHHPPGPEALWNESWYFDFFAADGSIGGWIRIGLYPNLGRSWYHAYLVGPDRATVAVADTSVELPKGSSLEIRAPGLWAEHIGTHPLERWQVANEAHALAVDGPADLYAPEPVGTVVPIAFDLEWETAGAPFHYGFTTRYEIPCGVHGEIAVGDERIDFEGYGQRDHSWAVRDWWIYRWVWCSGRLDDGTRFHGTHVRIPGSDAGIGYLQHPERDQLEASYTVRAEEELGPAGLPTTAGIDIAGRRFGLEPTAFAPALLVADDGRISRFPRALCRVDGGAGWAWTEWNQPQGLTS